MLRTLLVVTLFAAAPAMADPPKTDAVEKTSDGADKVICKRYLETGSLVKGYRVCKTKADWDRDRAAIRAPSGTSGSCSSAQTGNC